MGRMIPYFDGSTSYIAVPAPSNLPIGSAPCTVELIGISALNATDQVLFDYGANTTNSRRGIYVRNVNQLEFTNATTGYEESGTYQPLNHSIVYTYDGTTLKFYRNGSLTHTTTSLTLATTSSAINIGRGTPGNLYFKGFLYEVRLWNYARTQKEIHRDMYKTLTGTEQGLVGYWKLDEGGGTVAYDSCGTNHGTYVGNFQWLEMPDIIRKHESHCSVTEG